MTLPQLKHYKPRDLAVVYMGGKRHYLGRWGSPEALAAYLKIVEDFNAQVQREAAIPSPPAMAAEDDLTAAPPVSVDELCARYDRWARSYYVKRGEPTSRAHNVGRALSLLYRSGEAFVHPRHFGPLALTRFQTWLAGHTTRELDEQGRPRLVGQWSRSTMNEYISIVVGMFKWAVAREWVPVECHMALTTVAPLKRNRSPAPGLLPAPEGRKVQPVRREHVQQIRRRLPLAVRIMVDLQLLTGARPNEVCSMRVDDLKPTNDPRVLAYSVSPDVNKVDHLSEQATEKIIYLGPRAVRIIQPMLAACRADGCPFLFSPRRSVEAFLAAKRANRTLPAWPSHDPALRTMRRLAKGSQPRKLLESYCPNSYRLAIARACKAAAVPTWTPYRLRHNRATDLATTENLAVAARALGHASTKTTEIYVQVHDRKAIDLAARRG